MENNAHCKCYPCESSQHVSVQEYMESWCKHILQTPLTTTGMQVLFVVNSVKLHLTAFKILLIAHFLRVYNNANTLLLQTMLLLARYSVSTSYKAPDGCKSFPTDEKN